MVKNVLHCGTCGISINGEEEVVLEVMHTVVHKDCYQLEFGLKDFGTFESIVYKYDFFSELRAEN